VPGSRGTHAQLLVGAGYRSGDAIAAADADKLCADVLAFAASKDGQRVLRNGDPPDIEKIKGWLEAAQSVKAASASRPFSRNRERRASSSASSRTRALDGSLPMGRRVG
jgi:hypothetical protein